MSSSSSLRKRSSNDTPSESSTGPPIPKSRNNRGHPLFRATQTSTGQVGPLLRLLRYTQGYVTVITAVGVLWTSRAESIWFVAGALATSTIAKVLKKIIRDPRPDVSAVTGTYGLPSTHSSTVTFMCAYLVLGVVHRLVVFPQGAGVAGSGSRGRGGPSLLEMAGTILLVSFPPTVMWSRVALGVHTPRQVIAGALLGLICAVSWWTLWTGKVPMDSRVVSDGLHTHWLAVEADRIIRSYKKMIWSVVSNIG